VHKLIALALVSFLLTSCGGGGSDVGGGGGGTTPTTPSIATAGPPNVEPVVIDGGPAGLTTPTVNTAFVSVKICVPGSTSQCQIIDHVEIDTGSIGLRILASALTTVTLPTETDANGNLLAECLSFADNTGSWGSIGVADVVMPTSGETASAVNVQIIGSSAAGTVPAACTAANSAGIEDTVDSFGANGIIGLGTFMTDCNDGDCVPGAATTYYNCPTASTCAQFTASVTQQVPNPVALFAKDRNGTILELPAIADTGAISPGTGVLVFGIGTETNNLLGSATVLDSDPDTGIIAAQFLGTTYNSSYLDSGSNAFFINNSGAATCSDGFFLCPTTTLNETAQLIGTNATADISFSIANADALFSNSPNATAFDNLGASAFDNSTFDLGLPFFYGMNVYTAMENPATGSLPYYAFIAN
jgi:hypothetical protein